jgi:hypothetical protein
VVCGLLLPHKTVGIRIRVIRVIDTLRLGRFLGRNGGNENECGREAENNGDAHMPGI